ncbi:unnamed protein product [Protopolystoma xenopodis]|uniref:Uncharacterized protein n=1 Tax=Protopolystoma xenopodis TaxID=117903 RepID=A0A448WCE0_9PLAT|nr:unnamed protein product [Protopolystoma xenopodis]
MSLDELSPIPMPPPASMSPETAAIAFDALLSTLPEGQSTIRALHLNDTSNPPVDTNPLRASSVRPWTIHRSIFVVSLSDFMTR